MKQVFKNETEVVELIDRYLMQITDAFYDIEQSNQLADALRNTKEAHRVSGLREDVETLHREIEWRNGRLETLKEILAELKTLPLPFTSGVNDLELPAELPAPTIEVEDE